MKSIVFCIVGCLFAASCASAPPVKQPEDKAGFSTVKEALSFIVDCLEQDDVKRLTAACVGRGERQAYLAKHPGVFNNLAAFNRSKGLMKSYGDKTFPEKALVFKLGGHGKQFQHLHIDFVKKGPKWLLADIWNCR